MNGPMEQPVGAIRTIDVVLAAGLLAGGMALTQAAREIGTDVPWIVYPGWPYSALALALAVGPIATRRRFPLTSLLVTTVGLLMVLLAHVPEATATSAALFLTLHAAGRWGRAPLRTWARSALVLVVAVLIGMSIAEERQFVDTEMVSDRAYYLATSAGVLINLAFLGAGWWLGDVDRARAERERELTVRTLELEIEREERARQAVLSERLRIAREVHDVVAHHVSVMGIQAGAARRVVRSDPVGAEAPLLAIEEASRNAVGELQRLLLFLRSEEATENGAAADGDEGDGGEDAGRSGVSGAEGAAGAPIGGNGAVDRSPVPGLDQLARLRRQLADAGVACRFRQTGSERPLPPAVDLSAYRIVQESLTNVLKHGGVDRAELRLHYGPDSLTITVRNAIRGPGVLAVGAGSLAGRSRPAPAAGSVPAAGSAPAPVTGNGIRGMRERAALVGGTLAAGPVGDDRFEVEAVLPYDARMGP